MARKQFSELSPVAKRGVILGGAVQLALLIVSGIDLIRRPAEQVRGPKPAWGAALFVNFVGPIAYLAFGRRRKSR